MVNLIEQPDRVLPPCPPMELNNLTEIDVSFV